MELSSRHLKSDYENKQKGGEARGEYGAKRGFLFCLGIGGSRACVYLGGSDPVEKKGMT